MSSDSQTNAEPRPKRDPQDGQPSALYAWAQLIRLPNVFTVIADVSAAFLLVAGGPQPLGRAVCVVLGGIFLYWAGMILNDVFDIEQDTAERPTRPLPSGLILMSQAKLAGWSMLGLGVLLAAVSGWLPDSELPTTGLPAMTAVVLAAMIVAYDGPLKATLLAPASMGACRFLSFLLGASPCLSLSDDRFAIPSYLLGIAIGFGVYIMGITTMARSEATGGTPRNLRIGFVITLVGASLLAFSPRFAEGSTGWHLPTGMVFPSMIGVIVFPVIMRAIRTIRAPSPTNLQAAIRIGILTIIPLAASFAMLGAGAVWGLAVIGLVVPSLFLAMQFRVT